MDKGIISVDGGHGSINKNRPGCPDCNEPIVLHDSGWKYCSKCNWASRGPDNKKVITEYENKMVKQRGQKMSNTIKLKLNASLRGLGAGSVTSIKTDDNGIPLDRYWRNRIKDAEIDNCVEIIRKSGPVPEKEKGS